MHRKIAPQFIASIFAAAFGVLCLVATLQLSLLWPELNFATVKAQPASPFEYLSPRPNAIYVSAGTTIGIRHGEEINASILSDTLFSVRGEQSGNHAGRVLLADDKRTIIFQPQKPFEPNEVVNVSIKPEIQLASGQLLESFAYSFTVSALSSEALLQSQSIAGSSQSNNRSTFSPDFGSSDTNTSVQAAQIAWPDAAPRYQTIPNTFPLITATVPANGTDDGYLFLTSLLLRPPNPYLMIVDDNGEPVFYRALTPGVRHVDFRRQSENVLSYFDAQDGLYYLLDDHYQLIDSVDAGNGYAIDGHGIQINDQGHTLIQIYDDQPIDMSQIVAGGSPTATVTGAIVQELDPSGNVIFEWRSWDHIDILDAADAIDLTSATPDVTHINSVEWDNDENIIISNRHLDEVTKIDRRTADIIWRFGGKSNEFFITNDGRPFSHQHDARILPNGNLTIYDNGNNNEPQYSRAVEYELNEATKTATNVWEYRNQPEDIYGFATGSAQRLSNGNTLIGWGGVGLRAVLPVLTEVKPDGTKALELFLEGNQSSYRAFRFPWSGRPTEPATLVLQKEGNTDTLYYSWNGATDVASYNVYGGSTIDADTLLVSQNKASFETTSQFESTQSSCYFYRVVPILTSGAEGISSNIVFAGDSSCEQVATVPPTGNAGSSIVDLLFTGEAGTSAAIELPTNAISETVTILYSDQLSTTLPVALDSAAGDASFLWAFNIDTFIDASSQSALTFNQPVTVTLTYSDDLASDFVEESLRPYQWQTQTQSWSDAGINFVGRNPEKNQLTLTLTQSGSFAVFGNMADESTIRATVELINNGSFESSEIWTQSSTNLPFVVCDRSCSYEQTNLARSGEHWVTFEGLDRAENASISQQIIPPSGAIISATLSIWLHIAQASGSGDDTLTLYLNDTEIATIRDGDSAAYPAYTRLSFSVTNEISGPAQLRIESSLQPNSSTIFRLDDVSLSATILTSASKTYLPFVSKNIDTSSLAASVDDYATLPADFPAITVTIPASNTAEGYIFLSNHNRDWNKAKPYLLILDNRGEPVFYRRMEPGRPTLDFKLQPDGLLTYWDAATEKHHALDETYANVGTLEPANGFKGDFHEFQILPNGNKIFLIADRLRVDMSKIVEDGQIDATVVAAVLQEVDADNNVLFEWHSIEHIPLTDSWADLTARSIDYIHTNTVEVDSDGHWLISSRNTSEITKIDRQTGELIWRMGGRANEFTFIGDDVAPFKAQHDVRRLENGNILLFDNHNNVFSRAVEYELDEVAKTATLVWSYRTPEDAPAGIMGNTQRLPNGNTLVNLGSATPLLTEVRPDGTEAFQLTLAEDIYTYRAFRFPWVGRPTTVPKLVVETDLSDVLLRYSWNGATEVAAYAIYGDNSDSPETLISIEPKSGFETITRISGVGNKNYNFRVVPLDKDGTPLIEDMEQLEVVGTE